MVVISCDHYQKYAVFRQYFLLITMMERYKHFEELIANFDG